MRPFLGPFLARLWQRTPTEAAPAGECLTPPPVANLGVAERAPWRSTKRGVIPVISHAPPTPFQSPGSLLVAQSSATGVTVAGHPPVARSVFGTRKCRDTLHQPPPPPAAANERKCDRGIRRKVRHLDLRRCGAILARHLWFCGNLMRHSMARHCVARLVSPHRCATKYSLAREALQLPWGWQGRG